MRISVRAFGAMEIADGQDAVARQVTSRPRRVLLGLLLAHRGGVVSCDTLTEAMWPAARPAAPVKRLQVQVHRLRRVLAGVAAVQFRAPGYALEIPDEQVDIYQFERLLRRSEAARRAGAGAEAADLLRQALSLYRGPAFHGLDDVEELAVESYRLTELRLGAVEHRIAAELAESGHADPVGGRADLVLELQTLVAEHPLRERFRAQLMTALYHSGRAGEALAVYRAGEEITRRELGVELGPECRELAAAIRGGTRPATHQKRAPQPPARERRPAGVPQPGLSPRQLPPDIRAFTGRAGALDWLDGLLSQLDGPAPVVVVIDGIGGVGKTALAVRWGHRVAQRFPDGQLYLDLRGFAAMRPLTPGEAVARLLAALGVDPAAVPARTDVAAARLRGRLAGRRMLLILDDAATAEQVRPLLPGTGGCLVLVTSRRRLSGLVARDGAHRLPLQPLDAAESTSLLATLVGHERIEAEPAAAAALAELCGHVPLPLRVVAAGLAGADPPRLGEWVERLRAGDRLRLLAVPGDPRASVDAAMAASYQRLPGAARRMFRLLGLAPVPSIAVPAAAALAGLRPTEAAVQLAILVEARLLEEHAGRYTWHDLVRAYAHRQGLREEPAAAREAALSRLYEYYCATAEDASVVIHPLGRPPETPDPVLPAARSLTFATRAQAMSWVENEVAAIAAIVGHTAVHQPYPVAWRLADAMRILLHYRAKLTDVEAISRAAVAAAVGMRDPGVHGAALVNLAGVRIEQGRSAEAEAYASRALGLLAGTGWTRREALAHNALGIACVEQGRLADAARQLLAAMHRYEQISFRSGQAAVVANLAVCAFKLGRLAEAVDYSVRAAAVFAEFDAAVNEAHALSTLGRACYHLGRLDEAAQHLTRAHQNYRDAGDETDQTDPLAALALVHAATGDLSRARQCAESALAINGGVGNARMEPHCFLALATVHQRAGERQPAADCYARALASADRTGVQYARGAALIGLAGCTAPHEAAAARQHLAEAEALTRRFGYRLLEGYALAAQAQWDLIEGDAASAAARARRALEIHRTTGCRHGQAEAEALLGRALAGVAPASD